MTAYRNLTVDITTPRTQLDHCALAIANALVGANVGVEVYAHDLDAAIVAAGCDTRLKPHAVKALRNMGWAITGVKARHKSWYKLAATPAEYEDHRQMVVREEYSRIVTCCRELAGALTAMPGDLALGASLKHAQMLAISLGTDTAVGKTIPEVIAELAVLP